MGLNTSTGTLSDKYLLINTASGPGVGLVNQTIQFHGSANPAPSTARPAWLRCIRQRQRRPPTRRSPPRNVGSGKAVAFTFDLAKSIIYTRQGNPAQAATETDGQSPIRPTICSTRHMLT